MIKEIQKIDKSLLNKVDNILASELTNEEYDIFYNYFNEVKKPDIIVDITDCENIKGHISNLQKEIDRLIKRTVTLRETIRIANNNILKDISMIKTIGMEKQEIIQRLIETSKILERVD